MTSASISLPAKPSDWSVNPDAEKTTTGRAILRLIDATSGTVRFKNTDILSLGKKQLRTLRRHMQIIFQDPYGSLKPRLTVGGILSEPLKIHGDKTKDRVADLLNTVGLSPDAARRYPHEFSGGQRQRIGIARALAVKPQFIVADEPVSALDVSIQATNCKLAPGLTGSVWPRLSLYRTRPERGQTHLQSRGSHVSGQNCRTGKKPGTLRQSATPLYARIALINPHTRPAREGIAHHFNRRRAQPG